MPANNPTWESAQKNQPAPAHKAPIDVASDRAAHRIEWSDAPLRASIFPALKNRDMPMMHIAICVYVLMR